MASLISLCTPLGELRHRSEVIRQREKHFDMLLFSPVFKKSIREFITLCCKTVLLLLLLRTEGGVVAQ